MVDVYRVGITLAMSGNASQALSHLSHQFTGLHASAQHINNQFARWATLIGGAGAAMAGTRMLVAVGKIAEHGKELLHQQTLLRNLGVENLKVTEATAKAWETTRTVAGTKVAENLKFVGELTSVFGDVNEAIQAMPKFAQMAQVLGNVTGRDAEKSNVAYLAARAMELRGALIDPTTHQINPALFQQQLDLMTKVVQATHGKVGPEQWLNFVQQAGPAARMFTEGGMKTSGAVIQAMGGHRAGTAMSSLFQQFFGGIMTQRTAEELVRLGVIDEKGYHVRRGGKVVLDKDAVKGVGGMTADPLSFFVDTIIPAMKSHGFITQEDQLREIYKLFGRATTQRLAAELIQNLPQIEKEKAMFGRAAGIEGFGRLAAEDPEQVLKGLHAAWDNFLTAIGSPLLQAALPHIVSLTHALNGLAAFAEAHPTALAVVGESLAALGAALTTAGFIAIATAIAPLLGVGGIIAALAVALGTLAALNFDRIKAAAESISSIVHYFGSVLGGLGSRAGLGGTDKLLGTGGVGGNDSPWLPSGPTGQRTGFGGAMFNPFGFGLPAPSAPTVNNTFHITGDDPKTIAEKVLEALAKSLSISQNNNQAEGGGLFRSPFESGTGR